MSSKLDLRDWEQDEYKEQVFERLDALEAGETIDIVADTPAEVLLNQYQIKRTHRLDWEQVGENPWKVRVTKRDSVDEGELADFDVREMPPQRRHEVLLDTFNDLEPGERFVLVNDHDPKPLYHELQSMHGETFEWEYVNREPQEWKVKIVKTEHSEAGDDDVITKFDVRTIPKQERHSTIHHRYGMIPDGETIELIAPHEPRSLRREFEQQYGESFTWRVVEKEPDRCRVRITKGEGVDNGDGVADDQSDQQSFEIQRELDVRDLPPAQRHEKIFEEYDALKHGEAFVLVNDHDPKPLYYQFEAEEGDEFSWEYQQEEPGEFRVRIGKADVAENTADVSKDTNPPF